MVRLSCSSCNTAFTLPAPPANGRAECPRCGDVFPVRNPEGEPGAEDPPPAPAAPRPPSATINERLAERLAARSAAARWSVNRVLIVGAVLGFIGLAVGIILSSQDWNRRPEPAPPPPPPAVVNDARPATQLIGLGYLPADTNIAFAAQPGPFLAYAARTKQDPGELLARAGLPARVLGAVGELGLTLPQIDHVAGGTAIGSGAWEPRLALALVLRSPPADEDDLRRRLKAKKQPGGKARYDAEFAGLPVVLARVSATVWVFGFDAKKDLAAVEKGGYPPGGGQFPAGLREMIEARVPSDAAAWLATDDARWADKGGVKLVVEQLLKKPEWMPALARGRAALAALSFGESPRVRLFVRTADEDAGRRVRDYFREKAASADRATAGGAGELALFDAPADPASAYSLVQQFLADAKK